MSFNVPPLVMCIQTIILTQLLTFVTFKSSFENYTCVLIVKTFACQFDSNFVRIFLT